MPKKRRNNGRNKKSRGTAGNVVCDNCCRYVAKDKCIKKFVIRDLIDGSSKEDVENVSAYKDKSNKGKVNIPKLYYKLTYCVSCAVHARIVRARNAIARRVRNVKRPERAPRADTKKEGQEKTEVKV
jgi:small subunit ribosomal protein S26e